MRTTITHRHTVVDIETTGTDHQVAQVTEVAWYDIDTNERGVFIPAHTLDGADPVALEISRYDERIKGKPQDDGTLLAEFHQRMGGDGTKSSLWAANPSFEVRFLMGLFARTGLDPHPFHYRPFDLEEGAYWLLPHLFEHGQKPGLKQIAEVFGIKFSHHDAMEDVEASVQVIRRLHRIRQSLLWTDIASIEPVRKSA